MKQITFVKLYHGEIINITIPPKEEHHYEIANGVLWSVPNHQASRAEFMPTVSVDSIIAQGVNAKEVDITMPIDFQYFRMWCAVNGFKKHDAKALLTYAKHFDIREDIRTSNM